MLSNATSSVRIELGLNAAFFEIKYIISYVSPYIKSRVLAWRDVPAMNLANVLLLCEEDKKLEVTIQFHVVRRFI